MDRERMLKMMAGCDRSSLKKQDRSNDAMSDDLRHHGSPRLAEAHQLLTRLTGAVEFGVHHVDRALRLEYVEEVDGLLQRVAQLAGSPPGPFGRERGVALRPRERR